MLNHRLIMQHSSIIVGPIGPICYTILPMATGVFCQ